MKTPILRILVKTNQITTDVTNFQFEYRVATMKMTWYFRIILHLGFFIRVVSLSGQCPDRETTLSLYAKVVTSATTSIAQMVQYEKSGAACVIYDSLYPQLQITISKKFAEEKNYPSAIIYLNKAIQGFRFCAVSADCRDRNLVEAYWLLQKSYNTIGLQYKRMETIDSVISIEKRIDKDYLRTCELIGQKVMWLFTKGDYNQCVKLAEYGESFVLHHYLKKDSLQKVLYLLAYKVQAFIALNQLAVAENILNTRVRQCVDNGARNYAGLMYGMLAQVYNLDKRRELEVAYNWKSYEESRRINFSKGSAEGLISIASTYDQDFGRLDSADFFLRKALLFADRFDSLHIFNLMANYRSKSGQFRNAIFYFDRAYKMIGNLDGAENLSKTTIDLTGSSGLNIYLTQLSVDHGDAFVAEFRKSGNIDYLKKALAIYKMADKFITRIKDSISEIESNLSWRSGSRRLYENAIEASFLLDDNETAFYFFEKSRAVLLTDKIEKESGMKESDLINQANLKLKEQDLQKQISLQANNPTALLEIYKSITDYILYLKAHYGVEVSMFSFNESDLGINIRQTGEEHAQLIKGLGAYFASKGLKTKLLLGDNS
ncbi:MAG: hypothetical protein EOP48_13750, partial [Sphingobacteriales bacterium]